MNAETLESYLIYDTANEGGMTCEQGAMIKGAVIGTGALISILGILTTIVAKRHEKVTRAKIKELLRTHGYPNADDAMVDMVVREYQKYAKNPDGYTGPLTEIKNKVNPNNERLI